MSQPVTLTVPRPHGASLALTVKPGEVVYLVGPNGSGKSALLSHIAGRIPNDRFVRISADRQNWSSSDAPSLMASQRQQFLDVVRQQSRSSKSRHVEDYAGERISLALSGVIAAENEWLRAMHKAGVEDGTLVADFEEANPSPLRRLNDVLRSGALTLRVETTGDERILGRHQSGALVGFSQLSDGERNAILLAANVLSAPQHGVILIDEPERHLYRAITHPLLLALFKSRADCSFLIGTHDVDLPAEHREARTLVLRGTSWQGEDPATFDLSVFEAGVDLPLDTRRAVLGSRRRVLVVEGTDQSIDARLYAVLFPWVSVVPKAGCPTVIEAVRGLRSAENLHWVNAFGLIDRDNRSDDTVKQLEAEGVYALPVSAVEALVYGPLARAELAAQQAKTLNKSAAELTKAAVTGALGALADPELRKHLCAWRVERKARDSVLAGLPKAADVTAGKKMEIALDLGALLADEFSECEKLRAVGDLDGLLARYQLRSSPCLTLIAKALRFASKSDYEDAVIARALHEEAFRVKLAALLTPLDQALTAEAGPVQAPAAAAA